MFRKRLLLAALVVLAILPFVGCASHRPQSCNRPIVVAAPVAPAPACNSCPNAGPPPVVVGQ
jgi:predicted component of type VI protein secretion system